MSAYLSHPARAVIAIPAKNESAFIAACLGALSDQSIPADDILLVVNNTSDDTVQQARACASLLSGKLHVLEVKLPPHQANAGFVRRLAMERATQLAGSRGVVLTTDADARVPTDWIERNLFWLARGYDAVCGMAIIDPQDEAELPPHLLADDEAETRYNRIIDEIDYLTDPRRWDPWPRHAHRSGASIAVRAAVYAAVGGLPEISHSEDRGFIARLKQRDCKIRHDPELSVIVSGRRIGRAEGGMAATIARRLVKQDVWADDRLERPWAALRRAQLRREARMVWMRAGCSAALAAQLGLPKTVVAALIRSPWFGTAWALMEEQSPVLARCPILMGELIDLICEAEPLLGMLRQNGATAVPDLDENADDTQVLE